MMIFVFLYVCVMYNLSLNSSGTDIRKRKPTVRIRQKVKRLKVRLSGAFFFDKRLSSKDSSFVTSDEENSEGGFSIYNEDIKSYEEEKGALDEDIYDEKEVGNDDGVTDDVGIGGG